MLDLARQASSLAFELANTLGDDLTVPQVETSATKTEETRALVSERVYLGTHPFGWSAAGSKGASIDEHAAAQMLRKFAIAGGQHLDGAAIYPGETVLGVAAAAASMLIYPVVNAANGFLITSKAHPRLGGLDPKGLRDQLMRTRASLGYVEHPLAEYYLHQPDSDEPLLDSLRAMDSFVKEGLIERVGMQNYHAAEVERAFMLCEQHGFTKPSVFQGFYNPLNRAVEAELLPLLAEHGARFFAQNPLAAELLNDATPHAGSPLAATPQHGVSGYEPFPRFYASANTEAVDRLSRACEAEGVTLLEASYRWLLVDSMLAKELNGGVVLSASSPELLDAELAACAAAAEKGPLPPSILEALEAAWSLTKPVAFPYWRQYSADMPDAATRDPGASVVTHEEEDEVRRQEQCETSRRQRRSRNRALSPRDRALSTATALDACSNGECQNEEGWYEAWYGSFECWYLALPAGVKTSISGCAGALALTLGSRLDAAWRAAQMKLGRGTAPEAMPASDGHAAEPGCEWVRESTTELRNLPDFPELGRFDFTLPPIPRLVPSYEQMLSHNEALRLANQSDQDKNPWTSSSFIAGVAGGGASGAALAIVILGIKRMRKRVGRVAATRSLRK